MLQKIKLLAITDDIRLPTGVGIQANKLLTGLQNTGMFQISQIGGSLIKQPFTPIEVNGIKIYPTSDGYGNPGLLRYILQKESPDIILAFSDPRFFMYLFTMDNEIRTHSKLVFYHTWDNEPFPKFNMPWYSSCDYIVTLSEFSHNLLQGGGVPNTFIPHGYDSAEFYPLPAQQLKEVRAKFFAEINRPPSDFIVFWNNRNIHRKRINDTIKAFESFFKRHPDSLFIVNTNPVDNEGNDILHFLKDLEPANLPLVLNLSKVSSARLNEFYNLADVTLSVPYNEGFGLCVIPETILYTPTRPKQIKDIQEGDFVLSHTGVYQKVIKKYSRLTENEDSISIYPRNFTIPVKMSLNDQVFAIKGKKCFEHQDLPCYPYCYRQNLPPGNCKKVFEDYKPEWMACTELQKGDIVLFPKQKEIYENSLEDIDLASLDNSLSYDGTHVWYETSNFHVKDNMKKYPRFIPFTSDVFRLLGYYLAEGSHTEYQIEFAFNREEEKYLKDVIFLMKSYFGQEAPIVVNTSENCTALRYSGKILTMFFSQLGHNANTKMLPFFIFHSPIPLLKDLLLGFWRGDGSLDRYSYTFSTSSPILARQIFLIFNRLDIFPSFRKSLHKSDMGECLMYNVSCAKGFLSFLQENQVFEIPQNNYWQDADYFYVPIRMIQKEKYTGEFIDITVEGDHSFAAEGIIMHNCIGESLLCQTPVIATKTGGIIEQLTDGRDTFGKLLPSAARELFGVPGMPYIYRDFVSHDQIVNALEAVYSSRPYFQGKGVLGRKHIMNNYHTSSTIAKWRDFLIKVHDTPSQYTRYKFSKV